MRKLKKILMLIGLVTVFTGLGTISSWLIQNDLMDVQYTHWYKEIAYYINVPSGGLAGLIMFWFMTRR